MALALLASGSQQFAPLREFEELARAMRAGVGDFATGREEGRRLSSSGFEDDATQCISDDSLKCILKTLFGGIPLGLPTLAGLIGAFFAIGAMLASSAFAHAPALQPPRPPHAGQAREPSASADDAPGEITDEQWRARDEIWWYCEGRPKPALRGAMHLALAAASPLWTGKPVGPPTICNLIRK